MKFTVLGKGKNMPAGVARIVLLGGKEDEIVRLEDGSVEIGLAIGERDKMTRRKLMLLSRRAVMAAKARKVGKFVIDLDAFRFPHLGLGDGELAEILAVNAEMAGYDHAEFLSDAKERFGEVKEIIILNADTKEVKAGLVTGKIIGEETNACRRLANLPGSDATPKTLSDEAKKIAKRIGEKAKVKVLGVPEMKKLGMGGVLGVGQGSSEEPRFIVLEFAGGKKGDKPLVLVGKGVTFDTGGLNLKPDASISDGMNMDMSGAAAVLHTVAAAARTGIRRNIVALVPAVENMPSGSSYRPGDILRSMSGKTIEVKNTDAEGRIILADALTYAKRYDPKVVVDVATLTGAAMVALGERASALFTQDEGTERRFRHWGEESGDFVWPLPLWDEYDEEIKGTFGDVANIGRVRWGGAITAAAFLKQFADGYPWVHIDMAPRMTAVEDEFLAKGAAGAPVRLLVRMLREF
ncbi:MAG: leucyl aminopeptidase [Candidatus Moranbacteria bacterium]|nr:leucyl aminopeptidase [Candidatus Moranbacteria bacterium]